MLVITAVIAYVATLISGFLAYFTGVTIFPRIIESNVAIETISQAQGVTPFFSVGIPAVLSLYFDWFSGVMQAFIFSLLTVMYICTQSQEG